MSDTDTAAAVDHPFFSGMRESDLDRLARMAKAVHIDANRFIFRQGGHADCFLLIEEGHVALELHMPGGGARVIETIHGGDVLGWSWLYPPHTWAYDARAVTDVDAVCIDAELLRAAIHDNHRFGYEILRRWGRVVVDRLQATRVQLLDVYRNA